MPIATRTTAQYLSRLLPPDLMAQLERLELVTRKVFRGRHEGRAAQQAEGAER